jgi:hypothetical protein
MVLLVGFGLWVSYGIASDDLPLVVPNTVAFSSWPARSPSRTSTDDADATVDQRSSASGTRRPPPRRFHRTAAASMSPTANSIR